MTLLEQMRERRKALKTELDAINGAVEARADKTYTDEEDLRFTSILADITKADARLDELAEAEKREAAYASHVVETAETRTEMVKVTEPDIYIRGNKNGNSYFRDLGRAKVFGDDEARNRLTRSAKFETETRALGNTGAVGGSGGEFAPPEWLVDDYLKLIRAGRVTANLFQHMDIPDGYSSINLPKVATGTTTAIQSTQNTALSQTDLTTTYVQTGFATIGGKQVVSQQLLDQSAIPFDQVILNDLAADYAVRVGTQIYLGTGTGSGTTSVVNGLGAATYGTTTTWTQASPTVAGFYGQCTKTLAAFLNTRLMPPTCWVMNPRRWFWLVGQVDTAGRPLVVPIGAAYNPIATMEGTGSIPQGLAGYFLGLPVYIDPNSPANLGSGTNQDNVYLIKQDDLWLLEGAPKAEAFRETYADSVGVLFRMYGYIGTILNRYTQSIAVITGTGLVTPTFAS
jgi:HK97 family phage major capsid protein